MESGYPCLEEMRDQKINCDTVKDSCGMTFWCISFRSSELDFSIEESLIFISILPMNTTGIKVIQIQNPDATMPAAETINFDYTFFFKDGRRAQFQIQLEAQTLQYIRSTNHESNDWARLDNQKCSNCPLLSAEHTYCPIALNLLDILPTFVNTYSFEQVQMIVADGERNYSANVPVQRALGSLLGIIMVSSGCPIMAKLKPMVRFHLPFASVEETVYRAASTYLLGQYFKQRNGEPGDWDLDGLVKIYQEVQLVNMGMADRLRAFIAKDANINALVVLDIFAKELPQNIQESLKSLEYLFTES